ncbi:MAG TPA: hypothetical protein VNP04_09610 [Alphaproteobacteria bacterium]|nr:hypothetical protein [Alphaproteobacteria bacterium]
MERTQHTMHYPPSVSEELSRQWPRLRPQLRTWWDQLTDADLDQIAGQSEQLLRVLQARYGYARERAEHEVEQRLSEFRDTPAPLGHRAQAAVSKVAKMAIGTGGALQDLPSEVTRLVQRYPVPALLLSLGVGFALGYGLGMARPRTLGESAGLGSAEAGYPDAVIQCLRCGQMVRQGDMVQHSTVCTGPGLPGHGGSPV